MPGRMTAGYTKRSFREISGRLGVVVTTGTRRLGKPKILAGGVSKRVKVGQIGTAHAHAAGKMATLRKLSDDYEVVGIVESDPEQRSKLKDHSAYRGLKWISEEQLLNTPGLQAVAVDRRAAHGQDTTALLPLVWQRAESGIEVYLQRHVETVLEGDRQEGRACDPYPGSISHHGALEQGH